MNASADFELRYPREGNQVFASTPGDLIVRFTQLPHGQFKRQGNDLIYTHTMTLLDSLKSLPIEFTSLDGEKVKVVADEVISP